MRGKSRLSSKLMLAVVPLVAVLIVAMVAAVAPRFEHASEAQRSADLAVLWTPVAEGLDAISAEANRDGDITAGMLRTDEALTEIARRTSELSDGEPLTDAADRAAESVTLAREADTLGDLAGRDAQMSRAVARVLAVGDLMTASVDDSTTSREFAALTLLSESIASSTELESLVERTLAGEPVDSSLLERAAQDTVDAIGAFNVVAPADWQARLDAAGIVAQIDDATSQSAALADGSAPPVEVDTGVLDAPTDAIQTLRAELVDVAIADAADRASSSRLVAIAGIALAVIGLALALGLLARAIRSATRRLGRVSKRSSEVSSEQLPKLVEALSDPTGRAALPDVRPIEDTGHDEIREIAESFTRVQNTLVDVAGQQMEVMNRGVSDIFVTLARRNSSLVDRQLALLDELEADVEDPELLSDYYQLDHLATRMRRNAESLLVLARSETRRRRSKPVAVDTVVRAGISEIEDYRRVEASTIDPVDIKGNVAADVSHALAEILDNATSFSPPETRVVVSGKLTGHGYEVVVADSGIGLADDRIAELNSLLRNPPVLGLKVEPTLGLSVVSLLAEKHGIAARISANDDAGISMRLVLPSSMFEADPDQNPDHTSDAASASVAAERSNESDDRPLAPTPTTGDRVRVDASASEPLLVGPSSTPEAAESDLTASDRVAVAPLPSPNTSSFVGDLPAPPTPPAETRRSADDPEIASPRRTVPTHSSAAVAGAPTPTTLDEAVSSIMGDTDPLPTRRPGEAVPGFADDHSRSVAAPEPTRLGAALTQLAQSASATATSGEQPRLPDDPGAARMTTRTADAASPPAHVLPTRQPGRPAPTDDDRPVTRPTTDPEALRARLSAFNAGIAGRGSDTLVSDPPTPTEGPET